MPQSMSSIYNPRVWNPEMLMSHPPCYSTQVRTEKNSYCIAYAINAGVAFSAALRAFVGSEVMIQTEKSACYIGRHLVRVWIGGVWSGHFPESEKYFSGAELCRKIPENPQKERF